MFKAIEKIPDLKTQAEAYKAIALYGLFGIEPDEDASPYIQIVFAQAQAVLNSSINRYNACVENGKKGGRPKTKNNKDKTRDKTRDETRDETRNETRNETRAKPNPNLNYNYNVNDNYNDNYLFVNNNAHARVSEEERKAYKQFFNETFDYYTSGDFYNSAIEIIDTMINAIKQVKNTSLKFNHKTYTKEELTKIYLNLDNEKFRKIVTQVTLNKEIVNKTTYILGCLINLGQEESYLNKQADIDKFRKHLEIDFDDKK